MDILSIISAIGGLIGVISGASALFYVRQEKTKRELENDSLLYEQYRATAAYQEGERQRLLVKCEKKNAQITKLEEEKEKYLNLWLSERCVLTDCKYRKPPLATELPQSEEDTH